MNIPPPTHPFSHRCTQKLFPDSSLLATPQYITLTMLPNISVLVSKGQLDLCDSLTCVFPNWISPVKSSIHAFCYSLIFSSIWKNSLYVMHIVLCIMEIFPQLITDIFHFPVSLPYKMFNFNSVKYVSFDSWIPDFLPYLVPFTTRLYKHFQN